MLGFIRMINSDYAGVLSLLSSLIMVVVTIIYVTHTRRQANYAKESVELVAKQLKISKQPCIVPSVSDSYGAAFDATDYTRIQLGFEIKLKNVGDAPAINIYTLANIELQFTLDASGNKKTLSAALLPCFVQALPIEKGQKINIRFETAEVHALIRELTKDMELNWERLKTNPSQNHYVGAILIIRTLYKNTMEQWCESTISYEIAWLNYENPPSKKTSNLNRNTIPPKQIHVGDKFYAVLCSNHLAPFTYKMVREDYVYEILKQYLDESPWLLRSNEIDATDFQEEDD